MDNILKEFYPAIKKCIVSTDADPTLENAAKLFSEAKKDFPDLTAKQVKIVKCVDHVNQIGIEFDADLAPENYTTTDHARTWF